MISFILLASLLNIGWNTLTDVGHVNLLLLQDRIVLRRGEGGGVTVKPDPAPVNRSFDHGSRPLFGPNVGYAADYSSRRAPRYTPPEPLITSREVARHAVGRSVYGRRWGW